MTSVYRAQLSLIPRITNIAIQKINNLALKIYEIITARFLIVNKLGQIGFFEKIFLLVNTDIKVLL